MVDRGLTLAVLPPSPAKAPPSPTPHEAPRRRHRLARPPTRREVERRAQRLCSLLRGPSYTCRGHILIGDAWPPVQSTGTVDRSAGAARSERVARKKKRIWHTRVKAAACNARDPTPPRVLSAFATIFHSKRPFRSGIYGDAALNSCRNNGLIEKDKFMRERVSSLPIRVGIAR